MDHICDNHEECYHDPIRRSREAQKVVYTRQEMYTDLFTCPVATLSSYIYIYIYTQAQKSM